MGNKICGTLFDLNGVLVDAAPYHRDALDIALKKFGYKPLTDEQHFNTFNGLSTRRKLDMLKIPENEAPGIHKEKQKNTLKIIEKRCRPSKSVTEVVVEAKKRGPLAVVTNCSQATAQFMLEKTGLFNYFNYIVTNDIVGSRIKPDPYPYILGAELIGVPIKNCLIIDDNHHGIEAARNSGCINIWWLKKFSNLNLRNFFRAISKMENVHENPYIFSAT